ncbi:hypothetical protein WMY93_031348 [Mugilogobius chulae]|uniref:CCT-gamma n=1 Tax=Mugilogobius chulae TaxID=88201 RepID=A0AAW0MDK6_9GOBI
MKYVLANDRNPSRCMSALHQSCTWFLIYKLYAVPTKTTRRIDDRLGSTLSGEGKHHSHPPSPQTDNNRIARYNYTLHNNYTHTHKTDNNRIARYNYTLYYTQLHTTTHNYTLYYTQPHTTTHNHTQLHNACGARIVSRTDELRCVWRSYREPHRRAAACGARIVSRTDELREDDIGLGAGLFEVKKIGDEYFTFITECKDPKACTILLRGASKEILAEVERNLQDAMQVCRNVVWSLLFCLVVALWRWPCPNALEVIPRTLIQNCGASTIRVLTSLRAKHASDGGSSWGVNGETGTICDMTTLGIWEPLAVKAQTYKTAMETAILLLRIDDIVSGHKKKDKDEQTEERGPSEVCGGTAGGAVSLVLLYMYRSAGALSLLSRTGEGEEERLCVT